MRLVLSENQHIKTLLLLSLFFTGSAWAEWIRVSQTNTETFYIDPATIRKEGNLRTVWSISDLKQRKPDGSMSSRTRMKFDCKNERVSLMSLSKHSEAMAAGNVLIRHQYDSDDWSDVPPEAAADDILKIVCAK